MLGSLAQAAICRISNPKARAFLQSLPAKPSVPFSTKFPLADPLALDLLKQLLAFDPIDRISAADALMHPYFGGLPGLVPPSAIDGLAVPAVYVSEFAFDAPLSRLGSDSGGGTTGAIINLATELRSLFLNEALRYRPSLLPATTVTTVTMTAAAAVSLGAAAAAAAAVPAVQRLDYHIDQYGGAVLPGAAALPPLRAASSGGTMSPTASLGDVSSKPQCDQHQKLYQCAAATAASASAVVAFTACAQVLKSACVVQLKAAAGDVAHG